MLFHLVKKDFMIAKKYVLLMLIVSFLIPLFMLWRIPDYAGPMGFILSVIFAVFMLLQNVSLKEFQYPKASLLLCATPYPRYMLVLSKYLFCIIIYGVCCAVFGVETLFFSALGGFHFEIAILMLFVIAVFIGTYFPVQYKLGYEKTKYAFAVIIMASPFILPSLLKMEDLGRINFTIPIPPMLLYGGLIFASLIILIVSAIISVRFYQKTDLE